MHRWCTEQHSIAWHSMACLSGFCNAAARSIGHTLRALTLRAAHGIQRYTPDSLQADCIGLGALGKNCQSRQCHTHVPTTRSLLRACPMPSVSAVTIPSCDDRRGFLCTTRCDAALRSIGSPGNVCLRASALKLSRAAARLAKSRACARALQVHARWLLLRVGTIGHLSVRPLHQDENPQLLADRVEACHRAPDLHWLGW